MAVLALVFWSGTALVGLYLLAIWLIEYDPAIAHGILAVTTADADGRPAGVGLARAWEWLVRKLPFGWMQSRSPVTRAVSA